MLTVHPNGGSFYKLVGLPSKAANWVRYSVPQEYRYIEFEDNVAYWHVHAEYVIGAVELSYKQQGVVDYSRVAVELQIEIARAKENWIFNGNKSNVKVTPSNPLLHAYSVLYLLPSAPRNVVSAVWRALAKEAHPDQGGDPEAFKRYSKAYETIKKETK